MTASLLATPAPPVFVSWRASPPVPWHAAHAARRAAQALDATTGPRTARLAAVLARPSAFNPVARERLFAAVTTALGTDCPPRRHPARRHQALTATALARALPQGAGPEEEPGIGLDILLCLAGKTLDLRGVVRPLEVTSHAGGRFVERSGQPGAAALHAAVAEAAAHLPAVLAAHLDGPLSHRLRGGIAPLLLPAGEGAFLGRLRLLPSRDPGGIEPVAEASTWLHAADMDPTQAAARDVLLASLPTPTLLQALPEAWGALRSNVGGDRRALAGLATLPFPAGRKALLALATCPAMAAARLALGLACPDTLAAERRGAR